MIYNKQNKKFEDTILFIVTEDGPATSYGCFTREELYCTKKNHITIDSQSTFIDRPRFL